ncbi:MAG TPA: hypothetical protein VGG33_29605 [Polyangia bacterium]
MSRRSTKFLVGDARGPALCFALSLAACSPTAGVSGGETGTGARTMTAGAGGASTGTGGASAAGGGSSLGGSPGRGGSVGSAGSGGAPSGSGGTSAGGQSGATGTGGGGGRASGGTGGVVGDAAAPDQSPGSADGPSAPSAGADCVASKAKFCDDFDKQTAGAEPKGPFAIRKSGGGTIVVDATKPYSGTQSLHVHFDNVASGARAQLSFVKPAIPFPFAANTIHGRMMLFMSRVPTVHWDLVTGFATDAPVDNDNILQYILGSMYGKFMAVHQGPPAVDDSVDSATDFPVNRWACIQWEFRGAMDGNHHLRMLMDGKLVDKGDVTKATWKPPVFNSLAVGWINFQASAGALDMWIDDLAFGEQEIGCPAPK